MHTVTITITGENDAPTVLTEVPDQSSSEDALWSFGVPPTTFSDVDTGDLLQLSATLKDGSPLPSWLSFASSTGKFSGLPPQDFHGDIFIKLSATDSSGVSVSDEFTLSITPVNDAPVLSSPLEDVSVAEEATFKFFRPSPNSFTDVDGDALTYSATLESGAALPSWLKFAPSTGEFSGTAPTDFNGDIFIKVTAEDAKLSASDVFKLSITPVNDAPVALDPSFGSISEDVSFSGTLGTTPLDFIKFATMWTRA